MERGERVNALEVCPGCGAVLPALPNGPTHRYMESSPACWAAFNLLSSPEYALETTPWSALLVDAYAVHHPGQPSPQTINSVAIHLMVLHGALRRDFKPSQAFWLRQRPGRPTTQGKHTRFHWLTPPNLLEGLTVSDGVAGQTGLERSRLAEAWIREVWSLWEAAYGAQIEAWFEKYVLADKF